MTCNYLRSVCTFALAVVFGLSASVALGQSGTASLRGTITDPKGMTVANATVTITNTERGITLTTRSDKEGVYQFQEVRPATYELTVTADGFATLRQAGLNLLIGTPTTNDLRLEIAKGVTTVEVVASAQTLNTTDATIGNAFSQNQISSLPFEGRDPVSILSLQPGVVTMAAKDQVDIDADSRGGAVNGARSDQTNVTLDGIDNNDQLKGYAFTGALRATLDSIEEFRVTTTNAGADEGRSSGAQVQLQTKSGTNAFHGTAYEYTRPTNMVANDYFNKLSELQNDEPNVPPRLLRNTFGGSFGGPIKKDKLFFFLAYEGQRTRESTQVTQTVPSASLRDGVVLYRCADSSACPGGTVQGLTASHVVPAGDYGVGPAQILQMDATGGTSGCIANGTCPWGGGVDPNSIATMNQYPLPNTDQVGDGLNYRGYTFSAATPNKLDTYVARVDYNITTNQQLFLRGGLQNDHATGAPQFPGQAPSTVGTNNSKGIIAGWIWTLSPTKVNSFHYGFIRQGVGNNGIGNQNYVTLRGLSLPVASTRTTNVVVPLHNFTDDFSWTKGRHTISFGANYRWLNNIRASNASSYSDALANTGFLVTTGFAGNNTWLDPGCDATVNPDCTWSGQFPAVDPGFANSYDFPMNSMVGVITEVDATYQQDKNGNLLASPDNPGAFIHRHFRWNEFETYVQDAWRIKPNLTFTYGLRYNLLQAPYEVNGEQVAPNIPLGQFFQTRMTDMQQGVVYNPNFSLALSGPANGKAGYWNLDPKDLAPRIALAWSPGYQDGLLNALFGGPGKSSIRLGAGIYYDHFGPGIVNTFDRNGSFGLTTTVSDAPGTVGVPDAPRYTGLNDIPAAITPSGPTPGFPVTPPGAYDLGGFAIYWGLDNKLKTPYSYAFDLSFSRELKGGFTIEAAYVGRLGRRLLQEKDLTTPLNITDPKTGLTYFQAVTALAKVYRQGVSTQNFNSSMVDPKVVQFWADMMQPLQPGGSYAIGNNAYGGCGTAGGTTIPVVAAYDLFCGGSYNETTPLFLWDLYGIPDASDPSVAYYPFNGPLTFYQSQFASLYAWTSGGRSNYNAGQFMIRHRMSHGLSWDFNYTYSKSIDMTSDAERVSLFEGYGFGGGQLINAFDPGQMRGVSDYDMTHQINSNWLYELPFGHEKKWGANWNRALDAVLGGWSVSGLYRWSSGLPLSIQNGFDFPTDWELNGLATLSGPTPKTGVYNNCSSGGLCNPNMFANAGTALNSFDYPFPGQSGNRNILRGPGYFDVDASLRKTWRLTERQSLAFAWEVYNVTNSVRFDAANAFPEIDIASSFGNFSSTLTKNRRMEFSLRYSF